MPRRSRSQIILAVAVVAAFIAVQTLQLSWVPPPAEGQQQATARRQVLGAGVSSALASAFGLAPAADAYELPPLPYAFDALEPSIDKETMQIHHDKHHNTYLVNINKALEGKDEPAILDMQKGAIKSGAAFRNSGGGYYNHNFFWLEMAPTGTGGAPSAKLASAIDAAFGSMDDFKAKFEAAGAPGARFGSGWVWLIVKDGKLEITSTPNQDNPLMEGVDATEGIPILGIDVWEHAYYLKYQWQRPAYIKAWWDVVNWNVVSGWYEDALQGKAPSADSSATAAAMVGIKRAQEAKKKSGGSFNFKFNTGFEAGMQFGS